MLPLKAVSSYLTFSPSSAKASAKADSYFLWHYLFPDLHREAGYSPVHCSVLSGLSFLSQGERTIAWLAAICKSKIFIVAGSNSVDLVVG